MIKNTLVLYKKQLLQIQLPSILLTFNHTLGSLVPFTKVLFFIMRKTQDNRIAEGRIFKKLFYLFINIPKN